MRFVLCKSGTESSGTTLRLYVEREVRDPAHFEKDRFDMLRPVVQKAYEVCRLTELLGEPTLIT